MDRCAARDARVTQVVRRAGSDDVRALAALGARAFLAAFGPHNDPADIGPYVAEHFAEDHIAAEVAAEGSVVLLAVDAEDPGTIHGYARLRAGAAEVGVAGAHPVELCRLYVDLAVMGRGLGSALLRACVGAADAGGHDTIWLGVWEHNDGARRLYERHGFRRVGEHPFLLGSDLQTDHVMARPVRPH